MITASQMHRVFECPGSEHLPHVQFDTAFSVAGREKHAAIAENLEQGVLPPGMPQRLVPIDARAEVAMRYDALRGTAWELVGVKERGYPARSHAHEYDGTADVIGTNGDLVVVGDWKSRGEQTPARENLQLIFLATMAALIHDRRKAHVWIARTTEDGEPFGRIDEAYLDTEQMLEFGLRLHGLQLELAKPRFAIGKHCRYCPAIAACPEVQKEIKRVSKLAKRATTLPVAQLWQVQQQLKPIVRRFDEVIYAKLEDGSSVPLDDATELRLVRSGGKRVLDPEVCIPIARAELGEHLDAQLRPSLSQSQIKDAAREAGVPIAPTLAKIMAACVLADGITKTEGTLSVEVVPRARVIEAPIIAPPMPVTPENEPAPAWMADGPTLERKE